MNEDVPTAFESNFDVLNVGLKALRKKAGREIRHSSLY